jgi:hypothetical protein
MNSTTTEFAYSLRRSVAVLFMLFLIGLMALGYFKGSAQAASPAFGPVATGAVPASGGQQLAWLHACGMPGYVGAHRPEHTVCQPSIVWALPEFAEQLEQLQVLNDREALAADFGADARCPFVILGSEAGAPGRLCFSADGSVYRQAATSEAAPKLWSYTTSGAWTLSQSRLASAAP